VIAQMGLEIGGIGGIWRVATLYSVLDMVVGDPVVGSRRMQELDHRSQSEISIENVSTALGPMTMKNGKCLGGQGSVCQFVGCLIWGNFIVVKEDVRVTQNVVRFIFTNRFII